MTRNYLALGVCTPEAMEEEELTIRNRELRHRLSLALAIAENPDKGPGWHASRSEQSALYKLIDGQPLIFGWQ